MIAHAHENLGQRPGAVIGRVGKSRSRSGHGEHTRHGNHMYFGHRKFLSVFLQ
jgi:hypothetical protein